MKNKLAIQAVMDEFNRGFCQDGELLISIDATVDANKIKQFFKEKLEEILKGLRMVEENSKIIDASQNTVDFLRGYNYAVKITNQKISILLSESK